jgi:acetyl-CoA acetyltransferase
VKAYGGDLADLGARAAADALADAGIGKDAIDLVVCGTVHGGDGAGQRIATRLGLGRRPILNMENACASSAIAAMEAALWIRGGMARNALIVGVEQMSSRAGQPIVESHSSYDYPAHGVSWPVMYALHAAEAISAGWYDETDLAAVAVKNRNGAASNPNAQFHELLSIEDVLASRSVAGPLRLLMCSPRSDGAAALVLSADRPTDGGRPAVRLVSSRLSSGALLDGVEHPERTVTADVARTVYEDAGIGPDDIDVVELHDAFASAELEHYASLGLCPPGEVGALARAGLERRASVVVNPSGGLMSRGHPIGATGAAQLAELTRQLRGEAGPRQVEGARVALSHTMGGTVFELESNACMIHVLER